MKYKLEDLFDLQMGKTPARNNPEYWNSADNKWISIGDLSKCGKYITNTKEYLSDSISKARFVECIEENIPGFDSISFSEFSKIFDVLKKIKTDALQSR